MSRGIATISFARSDGASKAVDALNGLLVDGRPMKVRETGSSLLYMTCIDLDRLMSSSMLAELLRSQLRRASVSALSSPRLNQSLQFLPRLLVLLVQALVVRVLVAVHEVVAIRVPPRRPPRSWIPRWLITGRAEMLLPGPRQLELLSLLPTVMQIWTMRSW